MDGTAGYQARKPARYRVIRRYRRLVSVVISKSPRFKKWLPLVQGVPDFEGIRIHAGNYPDDTQAAFW